MIQILLIGIGAGAASALLFASITSGNILSVLLFYVAALPIMLASIAWGHLSGAIAILVAALSLGAFLSTWIGTIYLVSVGLPSYALAYLALLARPVAATNGATSGVEWYPAGRIVIWAALIAAGLAIGVVLWFGLDFETYRKSIRAVFERALKLQAGITGDQPLKLPGVENPQQLLDYLVTIMPPAAAVLSMVISLINLWLAGRVARVSGRLRRPWPDLSAIVFSPMAPIVFGIAVALSFISGMGGLIAAILMAVLTLAYSLLGFAVLHSISRGVAARSWLLAAAWLAVLVFGWPLLIFAMLGVTDAIFDLRGRGARRPPSRPIT